MAQIINLRSARKNRKRAQSEAEAKLKRQQHGRSRAERELEEARTDKARRALDDLRLFPAAQSDDPAAE